MRMYVAAGGRFKDSGFERGAPESDGVDLRYPSRQSAQASVEQKRFPLIKHWRSH